jgi:hypothetical protein
MLVLLLLRLSLQKDGRLRSELVAASRWLSAMTYCIKRTTSS